MLLPKIQHGCLERRHEGISVHGLSNGVRCEAKREGYYGGGHLPEGGYLVGTYSNWKKKYAELIRAEMKRLHELEEGANRSHLHRRRFNAAPRDATGRHQAKAMRPGRERELVAKMCLEWVVSIRHACRVLLFDPKAYLYRFCRPNQAALEKAHQENLRDTCALRLPSCVCCPATGWLGRQRQEGASDLQ